MPFSISYCVIFVTLVWGTFATKEDKIRAIFQNNMTRNDFSNLLKSLIKLNEQRVSVLQKLYRLEDYGILSEVLRTGKKKARNGNSNNLFLVVLSKNQSGPSRRNMDMQVVDSIPALKRRSYQVQSRFTRSESNPEQSHSINPTEVEYEPLKQYTVEVILDHSNSDKKKKRFEIDNGSHMFTTPVNYREEKVDNLEPKHKKLEFKYQKVEKKKEKEANVDHYTSRGNSNTQGNPNINNKSKIRYKSEKGSKHTNSSEESLETYDPKEYHSPKGNYEENHYSKRDTLATETDHNNKPYKMVKHVSNEHNPATNRQVSQVHSHDHNNKGGIQTIDISNENFNQNKHHLIAKYDSISRDIENYNRNKYYNIPKEKSNKNFNGKLNKYPKNVSNENDQTNNFSVFPIEKSKQDTHISKYPREHFNTNGFSNKDSNVAEDNSKDSDDDIKHRNIVADRSNENSHNHNFNNSGGPNSIENGHKVTNTVNDNFKHDGGKKQSNIARKDSKEDYDANEYANIPRQKSKDNDHDTKYSNEKLTEDVSEEDSKIDKNDNNNDENTFENNDTFSIELYGGGEKQNNPDEENKSQESNEDSLKSNPNESEVPESRKNFQKCLNKRALKLCSKSCISAYKNVCRRLKCTSRSKRALKKECKRSCKKSFSSSKYSSEDK